MVDWRKRQRAICSQNFSGGGAEQIAKLLVYFGLHQFGGTDYCARLIEVEGAKDRDIGPNDEVGRSMLVLGGDDRRTHDPECSEEALPCAWQVGTLLRRGAKYIDRDGEVGTAGELIERQWIGGAAIDQYPLVKDHRPNK